MLTVICYTSKHSCTWAESSVKATEVCTSNLSKLSRGTQNMIAFLVCIMVYSHLPTYSM